MGNPFIVTFGMKPDQYIPRIEQREQIISGFNGSPTATPAYVIIGVRGSGKTVMLSEVSEKIGPDWIVVDLSSQADMLKSLTSQLYGAQSVHKLFVKAKFDFTFMGIGVHAEESVPAFDYQTAVSMMLTELKKHKKKVLVTIDEVDNAEEMRLFASVFQILIRKGLPIFLLMAGIPENVYGLMNERRSTFLMRTPRILMTPLNYSMIKRSYMRKLKVNDATAERLASMTNGYSFAYQALGHVCWGRNINIESESFDWIVAEYDFYLQEFSYVKIWDEMSRNDRIVAKAIASNSDTKKVKDARISANMNSKEFGVYRDRLKKKGLLDTSSYGEVAFLLPRFAEFVREMPN